MESAELHTVSVSIPEYNIGRVIQPRGAGLARLRREAGVTVEVQREHVTPGMRCIQVVGTPDQVFLAQQLIAQMQEEAVPAGLKRKAPEPNHFAAHEGNRARHAYLSQAPFVQMGGQMLPQHSQLASHQFNATQQLLPAVSPFMTQNLGPAPLGDVQL